MDNAQERIDYAAAERNRVDWWSNVYEAVKRVREAVPHINRAVGIGHSPMENAIDAPAAFAMPSLAGLDEHELLRMLDGYRAELSRIGRTPEQRHEDADVLRPLGGEGAILADILDEYADAWAARRESLQKAAAAVEKRIPQAIAEREAAEAERAAVDADLVNIVKSLRAEIADLKAKA